MNAFFYLQLKDDGIYLVLIPEQGDGNCIDFKELTDYLNAHKIEYDKKFLMNHSIGFKEKKEIKLSNQKIMPVNEAATISINLEKTAAQARFYPPSNGGKQITREEIVNEMLRVGVKYGLKEEGIAAFLAERKYCTNYEVSTYLPPVQGEPAKITYYFNTDLTKKPRTNEDGSVDFHHLDNISPVEKGAVLATLQPRVVGKPGIDVTGNVIQPLKFENELLKHGKKIYLSEDGLTMYSEVSGHALLIDGKVFVEDTYEVMADVDVSTGDIHYDGNVLVKGSVRSGYEIHAQGDIIVNGVVEGAVLVSGGQIILNRGIQGMNKGVLKANSNIVSKFIESATIEAGGYVTTDAILHSKVTAKGDIIVSGKKGFITGGEIRSSKMIFVKTAGSTMGTSTVLEVGADPTILEEYRSLEKELPTLQTEVDKITPILTLFIKKLKNGEKFPEEKIEYIKTLKNTKDEYEIRIREIDEKLSTYDKVIDRNEGACVKVASVIYPGCKIVISNVVYYVRNELSHCCFVRDRADIKIGPL